jgi:hypothetical protein
MRDSSTGQPRVHKAPHGFSYAPMPAPQYPKGRVDRKLPGGLPPEPYRARNSWLSGNKRVGSDGTSKGCRAECFHSVAVFDRERQRLVAP